MAGGIVVPPAIGVEFAEQAVGGEEGEGLARVASVGEGALGVLVGSVCITRLPTVLRP
jgi:hypothetical protein